MELIESHSFFGGNCGIYFVGVDSSSCVRLLVWWILTDLYDNATFSSDSQMVGVINQNTTFTRSTKKF